MEDVIEITWSLSYSINKLGEDLTGNIVTVVTSNVLTPWYQMRKLSLYVWTTNKKSI